MCRRLCVPTHTPRHLCVCAHEYACTFPGVLFVKQLGGDKLIKVFLKKKYLCVCVGVRARILVASLVNRLLWCWWHKNYSSNLFNWFLYSSHYFLWTSISWRSAQGLCMPLCSKGIYLHEGPCNSQLTRSTCKPRAKPMLVPGKASP